MELTELLGKIRPADSEATDRSYRHWDSLAKPLGSLGLLEDFIARLAGAAGSEKITLEKRQLLILCADNGVVAKGISQSDSSVTAAVAKALGEGTSTVNHMAATLHCSVKAVDIGMRPHSPFPGVVDACIRPGTEDISEGAAMSREECLQAILTGARLAEEAAGEGVSILLTGEMGIGNTTTSCAVASVLLDRPPEELAGRGAGLSDQGLKRKIQVIERALSVNRPDPTDPIDVLQKVGGLDLAGLTGICLGGAANRLPVLLDGLITLTAALCAVRLCPECRAYLFASHVPAEPAGRLLLKELGLCAPVDAGLRLGEGSGAVAALPLLDMALRVYHSGHTFGQLGIEAYQKLS